MNDMLNKLKNKLTLVGAALLAASTLQAEAAPQKRPVVIRTGGLQHNPNQKKLRGETIIITDQGVSLNYYFDDEKHIVNRLKQARFNIDEANRLHLEVLNRENALINEINFVEQNRPERIRADYRKLLREVEKKKKLVAELAKEREKYRRKADQWQRIYTRYLAIYEIGKRHGIYKGGNEDEFKTPRKLVQNKTQKNENLLANHVYSRNQKRS